MGREHAKSFFENRQKLFSCTHESLFNLRRTSFHRFLCSSDVQERRDSRKMPLSTSTRTSHQFQSLEFSEKGVIGQYLQPQLSPPEIINPSPPCSCSTSSIAFIYIQIGRNSFLKLSRKLFAYDRAHVTLRLPQETKLNGFDPSSESFLFVQSLLCSIFKFS